MNNNELYVVSKVVISRVNVVAQCFPLKWKKKYKAAYVFNCFGAFCELFRCIMSLNSNIIQYSSYLHVIINL